MLKLFNLSMESNVKSSFVIFAIFFLLTLFLSIFITYGEQWIGSLNYYVLILSAIAFAALAVTQANDKILVAGLVFFLTFNADYPLIYHPQVAGGTRPTPEVWLMDIPLFVLLLKYMLQKVYLKIFTPIDKKLWRLFLIFIALEAVSTINAISRPSVFFQIIKDIRYFSVFWVLFLFIGNNTKRLQFVITSVFLTIVFQNSWGVLQFIKQSTFGLSILGESSNENLRLDMLAIYTGENVSLWGLKFGRYISGFAGSSYLLARENLLLFPLFLSMYLSKQHIKNRPVHAIGLFLIALGIFFGFSKNAWVSTSLAIFIIFVLEAKHHRLSPWKIRFGISFSMIIYAFFGRAIYLRLFRTNLESSFESRVLLNEFGVHRFLEQPLTGVGASNIWIYFDSLWGRPTTVHNLYLLFLSEIGLIGLTVFLVILFFILSKAVSINKTKSYYYAVSVGLTASFTAFYWDQIWTWLYRFNPVGSLFWALVAVAFAAYNISIFDSQIERAELTKNNTRKLNAILR